MSSKIASRILDFVFCLAILFLFFICCGAYKKTETEIENENQKQNYDVAEVKTTPTIVREIPIVEFNLQDYKSELANQIEEPEVEVVEETKAPVYKLDEYERWVVMCIVAGEAGAEPYDGKRAVAQCLLNAMVKEGYTAEQVKNNYQYSGWNSEIENSHPEVWAEIGDAVDAVFINGDFVSQNPILFFYAPAVCYSGWHEAQNFDAQISGHKFFYLAEDKTADWFINLMEGI